MKQKNTDMKKKKFNIKKETPKKPLFGGRIKRRRRIKDDDDLYDEDENLNHEEGEDYDDYIHNHKDDYFTKYVDDENDDFEEEEEVIEVAIEEKVIKKEKKTVDKTKFYVDPKEFDQEIVEYYKTAIMSNNLAEMISKISNKLSYAPNFINYSYREEMVGDGIIRMMKALIAKKYNRKKGTNPFSYFTRIAFNAFRNRIKKEKHIHETHEKYQKEFMLMSESFNHLSKNNNIRIMKERNRE